MTKHNQNDFPADRQSRARSEAAHWSARLHSGSISDNERVQLMQWRSAHPEHEAEFLAAEKATQAVHLLSEKQIRTLYGGRLPSRPSAARRRMMRSGLAIASMACIAVSAYVLHNTIWPSDFNASFLTSKGERKEVTLPDGSTLQMNTDSFADVRLNADTRIVSLPNGEISFTVRKDLNRPFLVKTGLGLIRVTGTQFNVRRDPKQVTVSVDSGTVQVYDINNSKLVLTAGQATQIDSSGKLGKMTSIDTQSLTAWRDGRLIFRNVPLNIVVSELNRYLLKPVSIADTRISNTRVTASFLLTDPRQIIQALPDVVPVSVRNSADGRTELIAR